MLLDLEERVPIIGDRICTQAGWSHPKLSAKNMFTK